uniref:Serpin family F member 2 n=1 Tax=Anolis carolinensis TaxID=28377 RepID=A0A803TBR5_ANOCA
MVRSVGRALIVFFKPKDGRNALDDDDTAVALPLGLRHGAAFAGASDWEESGQRNILQGLIGENAVILPTPTWPNVLNEAPAGDTGSLDDQGLEEEDCQGEVSPKALSRVAHGLMELGADLLREMERQEPQKNLIFSPFSIGMALAQLALGASNETERLLLEALHAEQVPCFHQALSEISVHLSGSALSLASRIYLQHGFSVKEAFLQDCERLYGARPATLSGDNEADLQAINAWVEEATGGQVPSMMSELPANTVMLLLNAIHFRGSWKTRFDPQLTEPSPFYMEEDVSTSVPMMKAQSYPLSWFTVEELDVQVARFPFEGNTSLVAILPNSFEGNFSQLLSALDSAWLRGPFPKERPTAVQIPKVAFQFQADLKETLGRLGLGPPLLLCAAAGVLRRGPLRVSVARHQAGPGHLGEWPWTPLWPRGLATSRSRSALPPQTGLSSSPSSRDHLRPPAAC